VIYSNLGPISHCFRDTAIYNLKLSIENCGQTDSDRDVAITDNLQEVATSLSGGTIVDPLWLTLWSQYPKIGIQWCAMTLQGHWRSTIFTPFESQYATSY